MCLNNSMDFIYMQIGLYLIGAVPVLLNPGRVGSGSFPRFNCNAVLVDNCHYAHVLRLFDHFVGAKQIFVFTNDLASLYIPHFVWIIDGSGYADFPADNHVTPAEQDSDWDVVAFSTRC
ncbi:unnamed protein product [Cylicostephanus goldi]|uniref:AMP-dependent synthetase/ligase domain-containing protein n=1 Tax=Cylicostephanus goldi TaxID=71465 RepID=A0A3P6TAZ3_CYLGO|nr:unnamed protein product [Cylicostephanus goldi]